jgi:hypothetical protein
METRERENISKEKEQKEREREEEEEIREEISDDDDLMKKLIFSTVTSPSF